MIPIVELKDLSPYTTDRLESELIEAIMGIGALKQKLLRLSSIPEDSGDDPVKIDRARLDMRKAKLALGTVHQVVMHELGRRRRLQNEERALMVEKCFVDLAKERLPADVFQDLLDEAVDKTRESQ